MTESERLDRPNQFLEAVVDRLRGHLDGLPTHPANTADESNKAYERYDEALNIELEALRDTCRDIVEDYDNGTK